MDDNAEIQSDPALNARLIRRAAARAAERSDFMAWVLARYREVEGVDDEDLAAFFGIAREALDRLALCGRPRPDLFKEDVEAIADHVGTDPVRLANVVRQVDSLTAFARAPAAAGGMLVAARTRAAEEAGTYDADTGTDAVGKDDAGTEPDGGDE